MKVNSIHFPSLSRTCQFLFYSSLAGVQLKPRLYHEPKQQTSSNLNLANLTHHFHNIHHHQTHYNGLHPSPSPSTVSPNRRAFLKLGPTKPNPLHLQPQRQNPQTRPKNRVIHTLQHIRGSPGRDRFKNGKDARTGACCFSRYCGG